MQFIEDENRSILFRWLDLRIKSRRSALIIGGYGVGKTELLKQIKKRHNAVSVMPLGSVCQLLGEMCGASDVSYWKKAVYLKTLCDHPRVILIDEAQHLTPAIYPYLKIIMDAGNVLVFSGLVELQDSLKARHPDVLSRMLQLTLKPLSLEDFKAHLPDFDEDALTVIYGASESTRVLIDTIDDCRDFLVMNKLETVTLDIAGQFITQ